MGVGTCQLSGTVRDCSAFFSFSMQTHSPPFPIPGSLVSIIYGMLPDTSFNSSICRYHTSQLPSRFRRASCLTGSALCWTGCEYAAVERVNREAVLPVLRDLVRQPFFRYFKVSLYCDCPFWPDDGMCVLRDCSVCPCEDHEVPAPWKAADSGHTCEGVSAIFP